MCPEVLEHIAQREDWDIEYVFLPFSLLLSHLAEGKIDLLLPIAYTAERAEHFDFNQQTFLVNWGEVYTLPAVSVQSLLDLASRKVAVVKDDVYGESLKKLLRDFGVGCHFLEMENYPGVFAAVKEGRADAGVVSRLYGAQFARETGFGSHLHRSFSCGTPFCRPSRKKPRNHRHYRPASSGFEDQLPICFTISL